jgi:hypothetical protein
MQDVCKKQRDLIERTPDMAVPCSVVVVISLVVAVNMERSPLPPRFSFVPPSHQPRMSSMRIVSITSSQGNSATHDLWEVSTARQFKRIQVSEMCVSIVSSRNDKARIMQDGNICNTPISDR